MLLGLAAAARADIYWGAAISGETYGQEGQAPNNQSAWDLFERHAGKKIAILNTGQRWATFEAKALEAITSRGAIPLVTMGLPEGVSIAEVASGKEDTAIRSWARAAREWGYPFLFAPWWEMNGDWYSWGRQPEFVAAWRHFHDLVVAEGATNVTWAWTVNSIWYDPGSDPAPYYPGDEYVDWVGIDTYNWGLNPAQPDRWINPDQTISPTLERVEEIAPGKPVAIVEDASSEFGGNKADWIREMLSTYLPHHPAIKAYLWFNWNFLKPNGLRADWPIESSAVAQEAFRSAIQSSLYRPAPGVLPKLAKVPPPPPAPGEAAQPEDLSPHGAAGTAPQVVVGPDGTATVVWSGSDGSNYRIYERRIAPDGTVGPPAETLSAPGADAFSPQLAVAPDGTVTVVWIGWESNENGEANFVVQSRRIAPDGEVGEDPIDLSSLGRDAGEPQVAVAPDGTATAVWKRFDGSHFLIKERRIAPDGNPDPTPSHTLSASHQDAVEPQVAVAADGTATVVWSRFNGSHSVIESSRVAPDGTPGTVTDLSAGEQNSVEPQVVAAPDGVATVVWVRSGGSESIVQARQISPGGALEAEPTDLSAAGQAAAEPQLAAASDSAVTAVWERYDGTSFIVQGSRVAVGDEPPSSPVDLSAPGQDATEPQLAIAPDGTATIVWSRANGSDPIAQERSLGQGGVPGAPAEDLSTAGGSASGSQVVVGSDGAVTAVWTRVAGGVGVIQGSTVPRPMASLEPTSYDFGTVALGLPPVSSEAFQITNLANSSTLVSSISLAGAGAGQFSLLDMDACIGVKLAPGASCRFSVQFDPSQAGTWEAKVEVAANSATGLGPVSLSGQAIARPQLTTPGLTTLTSHSPQVNDSFVIGRPILNRRRGTAKLPITVPGPGTVSLSGVRAPTRVNGAGTVDVEITAHGRFRRVLRRRGLVRVTVTVTFLPDGGTANSEQLTLALRRSRARQR